MSGLHSCWLMAQDHFVTINGSTESPSPPPLIWSFNYICSAVGKSSGSHVWRTLFKVTPLVVRGILRCVYKGC